MSHARRSGQGRPPLPTPNMPIVIQTNSGPILAIRTWSRQLPPEYETAGGYLITGWFEWDYA